MGSLIEAGGLNATQVIPCSALNREGLDDVLIAIERFVALPYVDPHVDAEAESDQAEEA